MSTQTLIRPAKTYVSLLDLQINRISDREVVRLTTDAIAMDQHIVIANHNLHSVHLWYREPRMRKFYAGADYVHIDGMSLILLGKLLGVPLTREDRATSLDFLPILAKRAVELNWRIFYLGSRPGVADKAAVRLRKQYPGLQIQTHHGHFDQTKSGWENAEIVAKINRYNPHILFVGMGMPRQEIWILENRENLRSKVIFPAGALMDYMAGEIPTAPRWFASLYLEWLYRLVSEPARLWRRYLVEPWFVMIQVAKHYSKSNRRDIAAEGTQHE